jgi:dethiobiotin synthetase
VIVAITAVGTEVGKTWTAADLSRQLCDQGVRVAARKPAQSFSPDDPSPTDAVVLGAATGEAAEVVCPAHRWYETPLAPPMAAARLGRPRFTLADLLAELRWTRTDAGDVGIVEGAGGVRSPIADDADNAEFISHVEPDLVVLVADAGLGTINSVRLCIEALAGQRVIVFLNRFDPYQITHQLNAAWLRERDGLTVESDVEAIVTEITSLLHRP